MGFGGKKPERGCALLGETREGGGWSNDDMDNHCIVHGISIESERARDGVKDFYLFLVLIFVPSRLGRYQRASFIEIITRHGYGTCTSYHNQSKRMYLRRGVIQW